MSKQLAEEYYAKAKYTASKTGFFDTLFTTQETIFEEAADCFAKAGNHYRLAKMPKEAGDSFCEAADLFKKCKNNMDNIMLQYAVDCYTLLPHNDENFKLIDKYTIDIIVSLELNSNKMDFSKIGKLYESLGDYYPNDISSTRYYNKALEYYDATFNANYTKQTCLNKIATLYVNNQNFNEAVLLYHQIVNLVKSKNIISGFQHLRHLANIFICYIGTGDLVKLKKFIRQCNTEHQDFVTTSEYKSLYVIYSAMELNDIEEFDNQITAFRMSKNPENWKIIAFEYGRKSMDTSDHDFS